MNLMFSNTTWLLLLPLTLSAPLSKVSLCPRYPPLKSPPLLQPPPPPPRGGDLHFTLLLGNICCGGLCSHLSHTRSCLLSLYFESVTCVYSVIFSL